MLLSWSQHRFPGPLESSKILRKGQSMSHLQHFKITKINCTFIQLSLKHHTGQHFQMPALGILLTQTECGCLRNLFSFHSFVQSYEGKGKPLWYDMYEDALGAHRGFPRFEGVGRGFQERLYRT